MGFAFSNSDCCKGLEVRILAGHCQKKTREKQRFFLVFKDFSLGNDLSLNYGIKVNMTNYFS